MAFGIYRIWKDQNIFEPLAFDDDIPPFTYLYIDNDCLYLWDQRDILKWSLRKEIPTNSKS